LESHLNTSFKHFVLFAKEFEYVYPSTLDPVSTLSFDSSCLFSDIRFFEG